MAEQRSTEEVPGMAEAIEARRRELGLGPKDFAREAGVTEQALLTIRKGYRRNYQDKLKFGVARALGWPPDAVDRLLAGRPPVGDAGTLGDLLTEEMQRRGHTSEDLGAAIGVSKSRAGDYVRGSDAPPAERHQAIADYLHLDLMAVHRLAKQAREDKHALEGRRHPASGLPVDDLERSFNALDRDQQERVRAGDPVPIVTQHEERLTALEDRLAALEGGPVPLGMAAATGKRPARKNKPVRGPSPDA